MSTFTRADYSRKKADDEGVALAAALARYLMSRTFPCAGGVGQVRFADAFVEWAAPEEVYAPAVDEHPDHRTLAEVGRRAHAESGTDAALWEYPVRYWQRVPWVRSSGGVGAAAYLFFADPWREWRRPRAMLIQTEGFQDKKLAALNVYAGEMEAVGDKIRPYLRAGYEVFFPLRSRR